MIIVIDGLAEASATHPDAAKGSTLMCRPVMFRCTMWRLNAMLIVSATVIAWQCQCRVLAAPDRARGLCRMWPLNGVLVACGHEHDCADPQVRTKHR